MTKDYWTIELLQETFQTLLEEKEEANWYSHRNQPSEEFEEISFNEMVRKFDAGANHIFEDIRPALFALTNTTKLDPDFIETIETLTLDTNIKNCNAKFVKIIEGPFCDEYKHAKLLLVEISGEKTRYKDKRC